MSKVSRLVAAAAAEDSRAAVAACTLSAALASGWRGSSPKARARLTETAAAEWARKEESRLDSAAARVPGQGSRPARDRAEAEWCRPGWLLWCPRFRAQLCCQLVWGRLGEAALPRTARTQPTNDDRANFRGRSTSNSFCAARVGNQQPSPCVAKRPAGNNTVRAPPRLLFKSDEISNGTDDKSHLLRKHREICTRGSNKGLFFSVMIGREVPNTAHMAALRLHKHVGYHIRASCMCVWMESCFVRRRTLGTDDEKHLQEQRPKNAAVTPSDKCKCRRAD